MFGVPKEIVSDNGPQFRTEYDNFCRNWEIQHTLCSPRHPRSNGYIERQIRYIKPIIKKSIESGGDIDRALLNVRATPLDSVLPSPGELMFGHPLPTTLPSRSAKLAPEVYRDHLRERTASQKLYADQHTKPLPPLSPGQRVTILNKENKTWFPAKVTNRNNRAYTLLTNSGRVIKRNRQQLREATQNHHNTHDTVQCFVNDDNIPLQHTADTHDTPAITNNDVPPDITHTPPPEHNVPVPRNVTENRGILKHNNSTHTSNKTTRSGRIVKQPVRFMS